MNASTMLSVLCRAPAAEVKMFAEELIPDVQPIEVLHNRTGLVMLPSIEPVHGTAFYLGEALIAEAYVQVAGTTGYAACLGRDIEQALAIAIIDAANAAAIASERIHAFVQREHIRQQQEDAMLMAQVAATRVEMETF
jgi:alpha-D-ribose 1-methylphosphonate 5-triphosphate synthase subunit PhnG